MILAAWHLLVKAIELAINEMGTSVLGFAVAIGLPAISMLIALLKDGTSAMREHWKKKAGIGLIPLVAIWSVVVVCQMAALIYAEHVEQRHRIQNLVATLESNNDLFKDAAIEWDGKGNAVLTIRTIRAGEDLRVYLDIRQSAGMLFPDSFLFEGQLAKQPRVEIGAIPHFVRDENLKITLATVSRVPGNQTVFQWGDAKYENYKVGVNYSGYVGRLVITEKNNPMEYHSYFAVVGRTFFDEKFNATVVGPAFIIGPNIMQTVKNWDAS
jgi:hypothetical protein